MFPKKQSLSLQLLMKEKKAYLEPFALSWEKKFFVFFFSELQKFPRRWKFQFPLSWI